MIQLTPNDVVVEPGDIERLREEFAETGCAMLPGFLSGPILQIVRKQVASARFVETNEVRQTDGFIFGNTLKLPDNDPAILALNFVLNRPTLFELAAQIAGTPRLGNFLGRLHRTTPESLQHIDWHDDTIDFRSLALDINLSEERYGGGLFQIRGPDRRIRREVSEWSLGDAFLFKIGGGWQHRLTRVESGERTVGVGWFRTYPATPYCGVPGFAPCRASEPGRLAV